MMLRNLLRPKMEWILLEKLLEGGIGKSSEK